jgi:GNAT superfamily N-acetyltransferase
MADLPAGFTGRRIDPDQDVADILELLNAVAVAERGVADIDERLVRGAYSLPAFHPETDSWIVHDAQGRVAGIADHYDGDEHHVAPYLFLRVRPDLAAGPLTDALLAHALARANETVDLAPAGARVALRTDVAATNPDVIAAFERNGWQHDRTNWVMEINLAAAPIPEPAWPDGIRVRSADLERDARAVHAADLDAFSDHYGFVPQPFEEWFHFRTEFVRAEPDLWFLAVDDDRDGEIAGIAICSSERTGQPDLGWVSILGVRRAWRRRGIALALLRHAFRELAARGKPRAGLGVDSESLTGATRLYERAGMRVVREGYEYERVLRDGRDLRTVALPGG